MIAFKDYVDVICETAEAGLDAKAEKSGISINTLRKVYRRGVAAWNSGHRPGTTPQQWGMARVNSYITKGKGTYHGADKDLHEELDESESWESGYKRRVVKTTDADHKEKGYNWRIKGKERPEISIKLYKEKPSQSEFNAQMKRVAGHEFGEALVDEDSRIDNKAYHKGLSDSTARARVAHWKKMDNKSDSDPSAYEPAPGDATAKTKPSKHTIKYHAMYGESIDEEILEACWVGYKQVGVKKKGNKMVPNCVPEDVDYMFHPIAEAVKAIDSGEYDYEGQMARTQLQTILRNSKDLIDMLNDEENMPEWVQSKITLAQDYITCVRDYLQSREELGEDMNEAADLDKFKKYVRPVVKTTPKIERTTNPSGRTTDHVEWKVTTPTGEIHRHKSKKEAQAHFDSFSKPNMEELEAQFDLIESAIEELALINNVDSEILWEKLEEVSDEELLEYAIDSKGYKSSEGGLTQKGVDAYNRKTGGNLQTAVTTKPSKLKPGSKAANRRKSFCARMGGMKKRLTSAETARDPDSRINKALRKWNC